MLKQDTEKIILGIDPGTTLMGYGVIRVIGNKAQMVAMGVIDLRKMPDPYLRLGHIFERVAGMLKRMLKLSDEDMPKFMDATDALGAAYCHFLQMGRPETDTKYKGWKDFVSRNQNRVAGK